MESRESPLEVLSRAATMIQENQEALASSTENNTSNKQSPTNNKHLSTTKWKRERRNRLPEYSRKADSKSPNSADSFTPGPRQGSASPPDYSYGNGASEEDTTNVEHRLPTSDAPLDMTVRQRGLPPSYAQAISHKATVRPSVIQNQPVPPTSREPLPSGISMCDPIIDEHFRRSLGKDYQALFQNNNVTPKETSPPLKRTKTPSPERILEKPREKSNTHPVLELMDNSGLSVDDHFAKALGDTWTKLNKKDTEIKGSSAHESNLLSI